MAESEILQEAKPVFMDAGIFIGALLKGDPRYTEIRPLAEILARVEQRIIAEALELESHNRTRTAARLGITRKTLLAKITAYGLT